MTHRKCFLVFVSMVFNFYRIFSAFALHQRFPITKELRRIIMKQSCAKHVHTTSSCSTLLTRPQVLILAGATSVGKSAVSMELCKRLDGEIVIADSVQVYKGLDIGANKPTFDDQQIVPHHLIDICEPSEQMNTAEFCEAALKSIEDIVSRNKIPIVVGGSTMWIQWLVHGKPDAPKASDVAIQRAKEMMDHLEIEKRWEDGLNILKSLDSERAAKLPKNDWYRLRRYLEIAIDLNEGRGAYVYSDEECVFVNSRRLTGSRVSFLKDFDVRCFFLMEAREQLYHTIDHRCELMLEAGLLEEVFQLLSSGRLQPAFPISRSIGYRQVIEYFCRRVNKDDMKAFEDFLREFATATRNYAKKQCNWYRKDEKFLFMKMDRKSVYETESVGCKRKSSSLNPYEQCGEEILHWLGQSEIDFQDLLKNQLKVSTIFNRLLSTGTVDINHRIKDKDEFRVIHFLSECNAIKCSQGKNQQERKSAIETVIQNCVFANEAAGENPISSLSALDVDVRAGEVGDRHQAMKTFSSRLFHGEKRRFETYMVESDRYREILWRDHYTLMESFASSLL